MALRTTSKQTTSYTTRSSLCVLLTKHADMLVASQQRLLQASLTSCGRQSTHMRPPACKSLKHLTPAHKTTLTTQKSTSQTANITVNPSLQEPGNTPPATV